MALPLTLIVITGEIDLSVASMLGLCGVLMAELFKHGWPIWPAMIMAVVLGAFLGAFNGFLVTRLGLPSLAVTIGTLTLYRGIARGSCRRTRSAASRRTSRTSASSRSRHTHIPYSIAFFLALAVVFARRAARDPARARDLRDRRSPGSGVLRRDPSQANQVLVVRPVRSAQRLRRRAVDAPLRLGPIRLWRSGMELFVVTIVLLGGVSIFGGRGTILGVVLAVAVLGCLQTALTADLIPAQDQNIVVGGLLLASVIVPNAAEIYRRARARLRSAELAATPPRAGGGRERRRRPASASSASASPRTGRSSRGCANGSRATGRTRGAARELGADVVSAGLVDTPEGARRGRRVARRRARRAGAPLHGDLRHVVAGAPGGAGRRGAGRRPQPPADSLARLRGHDHRRVARELLGLLRPRARGRLHPGTHPVQHGHRHAAGRRSRLGGDRRVGRRCPRGAGPAVRPPRVPRPHLPRDARHVLGLHPGPRSDRRPRGGAGDRRARRQGRLRRPRRDRAEGRRDPASLRPRRPGRGPDRSRAHAGGVRVVGAGRRRARPARRGLRPRRADVLLPRRRRERQRTGRSGADRRQLSAHRARRARRPARAT